MWNRDVKFEFRYPGSDFAEQLTTLIALSFFLVRH
jgi:hypothetical protein